VRSTDGKVICWGDLASLAVPADPRQIAIGRRHVCVLRQDNTLACAGDVATPFVGSTVSFDTVSSGDGLSCGWGRVAGAAAKLHCWGKNVTGNLAVPPALVTRSACVLDREICFVRSDKATEWQCWDAAGLIHENASTTSIAAIECGSTTVCVRTSANVNCQTLNAATGSQSFPAGTPGTALAVGGDHACKLDAGGVVECLGGANADAQRGVASKRSVALGLSPTHGCFMAANPNFTSGLTCFGTSGFRGGVFESYHAPLATGTRQSCGIRRAGPIDCTGYPPPGVTHQGTFTDLSGRWGHMCALHAGGAIFCWGDNGQGQLNSPSGSFVRISAGKEHSCAVDQDGKARCWGLNDKQQSTVPPGRFVEISAGGDHSCAIGLDGALVCWGDDSEGERRAPAGVFSRISAGNNFNCAVRTSGELTCWGADADGRLSAPAGLFNEIVATETACGLRRDGRPVCWGKMNFDPSRAP
jgi:hypothetical protein